MFSKLELKRILSKHQCTIKPDLPVFFSENWNKMADSEMRTAEEMLDYEPADDESGSEAPGGQDIDLTSAKVSKLLEPEVEPDSMGDAGPKYQPPFPAAKGKIKGC